MAGVPAHGARVSAALHAAWIACGRPCPYGAWAEAFASWEVEPVMVDGEIVGAVMAKGPEVHVAVLPHASKRWCSKRLWKWAITDRLAKFGRLVTFGKSDSEFIRRAGFVPVGTCGDYIKFERCA